MDNEIKGLDAILLAADAEHNGGNDVIKALQAIASILERQEPVLGSWLKGCLSSAALEGGENQSTAVRQRGFSRALGYTAGRGNPHEYGERNFRIVWAIWHIHKSRQVSLSEALGLFIEENPSFCGANGSTDYIQELVKKHRSAVSDLYEQWIDMMEENNRLN